MDGSKCSTPEVKYIYYIYQDQIRSGGVHGKWITF